MKITAYILAFKGIFTRETQKYLQQKSRFFASLIRPLIWLFIFAAGFRSILGVSIIPPYETYILYEEYITPGLLGTILLFNNMQSSLSMVYDKEMGSMRVLLTSPLPRWYLLAMKLLSGVWVAIIQVYIFLAIAWFWDIRPPVSGYFYMLPTLLVSGMMLGSIGLVFSSFVKRLENFAGIMNFIIFPMFFASSALYPLWRMRDSSELLFQICTYNPFTYVVELTRFSLYAKFNPSALLIVTGCLVLFFIIAVYGYNPRRGLMRQKQ